MASHDAAPPDFDAELKALAGVTKVVVKKSVMAGIIAQHAELLRGMVKVRVQRCFGGSFLRDHLGLEG